MALSPAPPVPTTTFTPSPSCLSYLYATSIPSTTLVQLGLPTGSSACFPPGWNDYSLDAVWGIFCPSGYVSACTSLGRLGTTLEGRSTVVCCPSGYNCNQNALAPACMSTVSSATTLDLYISTLSGRKSGSVTVSSTVAWADSVQLNFEAADLVTTSSSKSGTTSSITSISTRAVTDIQSHGLSTGAKAGIGVGVAIGVIALLLLGALLGALLLRQRQRKVNAQQSTAADQLPYGIDSKPRIDGQNPDPRRDEPGLRPELDEIPASQGLDVTSRADSNPKPAELGQRSRVDVNPNPEDLDATIRS